MSPKTQLGINGDFVIRLVSKIQKHQKYEVYIDNSFTSYSLLCAPKEIGMYGTGTVKSNRLPGCSLKSDSELKKESRGSCDIRTETSNNITVVKWYDSKPVYVASTSVGKNPVTTTVRCRPKCYACGFVQN